MVVLAYFLISVITDGIRYSFGVMLISLVEAFGKGSGETAWVGGLMAGTCNLSGKFVRLFFLKTIPSQYTVSGNHRPVLTAKRHLNGNRNLTEEMDGNCFVSSGKLRVLNSLPEDTKQSPSISSFKFRLKSDMDKPPKYYNTGTRMDQILPTRIRLECSSLNAHLGLELQRLLKVKADLS